MSQSNMMRKKSCRILRGDSLLLLSIQSSIYIYVYIMVPVCPLLWASALQNKTLSNKKTWVVWVPDISIEIYVVYNIIYTCYIRYTS